MQASSNLPRHRTQVGVQPRLQPRLMPSTTLSGLTLLTLTVAVLLLMGCDGSPTAPDGDVNLNFQTMVKTTLPNRFGPQFRRPIRDPGELAAVWSQLWMDGVHDLPLIDFSREMVIVATARESCFGDVTIERLEIDAGALEIGLAEPSSAVLCLCFAPEYTFHVVRTARVDLPERFASREVPSRCGG